MFQVPTKIWNQIAKTQVLENKGMLKLFLMDHDNLVSSMNLQAKILEKNGNDPIVIAAYQKIFPLYAEHKAIQNWITTQGNSDLMAVLPEVQTLDELIKLSRMECRMDTAQQNELLNLSASTMRNSLSDK